MNPYNPEKVAMANELYSKLKEKNLSYSDYVEIKSNIQQLCEGEQTKKSKFNSSMIKFKFLDKVVVFILLIVSIIYYVNRCDDDVNDIDLRRSTENAVSKEILNDRSTDVDIEDDTKIIGHSLKTGSSPYENKWGKNYICPQNKCSGIEVTAPKESDLVVIIKQNNKDGKVVSHGYIKAGETFHFDLPNGTYQSFFYYGKGWNENKEMGNGLEGGFVSDEVFSKDSPQVIKNAVLTYKLQLVRDGNFSTHSSNRSEIF